MQKYFAIAKSLLHKSSQYFTHLRQVRSRVPEVKRTILAIQIEILKTIKFRLEKTDIF